MANTTRKARAINVGIRGFILGSALMAVGCTQALARHDVFERSDVRIGRSLDSARRTCQQRQPNNTQPSGGEYERCVLEALRGTALTQARQ